MKKLAIFGMLLFMSGCAITGKKMTPDIVYADLSANAQTSINSAASVDGEWRDARKILAKAESDAKAGDFKKAIKLAKFAKFQGDMGYKQAMDQKNAGPWLF